LIAALLGMLATLYLAAARDPRQLRDHRGGDRRPPGRGVPTAVAASAA
jgi:hypothetical protein